MISIEVKIDKAQTRLGKLPDDLRAALKAEANDLATKLRDKVRENFTGFFRSRSGELIKNLKKSVRSNKKSVTAKVFFKHDGYIAHILEVGAKPHKIEVKNAKALAFLASGGEPGYAVVVNHPGFGGHSFFSAAWEAMKPEIRQGMEAAVRSGIKVSAESTGVTGGA